MTSAQRWLQDGFQAQRAGELDRAQTAYEQVLRLDPAHPDACQLLGLLARRHGDEAAAERWLRRSLQSREAQPHVWNNLGNVLLATGRGEEALRAYDARCNSSRAMPTPTTTAPARCTLQSSSRPPPTA
jgi:Tfp pilus assembly protein PilF